MPDRLEQRIQARLQARQALRKSVTEAAAGTSPGAVAPPIGQTDPIFSDMSGPSAEEIYQASRGDTIAPMVITAKKEPGQIDKLFSQLQEIQRGATKGLIPKTGPVLPQVTEPAAQFAHELFTKPAYDFLAPMRGAKPYAGLLGGEDPQLQDISPVGPGPGTVTPAEKARGGVQTAINLAWPGVQGKLTDLALGELGAGATARIAGSMGTGAALLGAHGAFEGGIQPAGDAVERAQNILKGGFSGAQTGAITGGVLHTGLAEAAPWLARNMFATAKLAAMRDFRPEAKPEAPIASAARSAVASEQIPAGDISSRRPWPAGSVKKEEIFTPGNQRRFERMKQSGLEGDPELRQRIAAGEDLTDAEVHQAEPNNLTVYDVVKAPHPTKPATTIGAEVKRQRIRLQGMHPPRTAEAPLTTELNPDEVISGLERTRSSKGGNEYGDVGDVIEKIKVDQAQGKPLTLGRLRNLQRDAVLEHGQKVAIDHGTQLRKEGVVVILAGPPGSGKSTIAHRLGKQLGAYEIDSDFAKLRDPRYQDIGASGVHEESSEIALRATNLALARRDNIITPLIGKNTEQLYNWMKELRDSGHTVYYVMADLSPEDASIRAFNRSLAKGRVVGPDYVLNAVGRRPQDTFDFLKGADDLHGGRTLRLDQSHPPEVPLSNRVIEHGPGFDPQLLNEEPAGRAGGLDRGQDRGVEPAPEGGVDRGLPRPTEALNPPGNVPEGPSNAPDVARPASRLAGPVGREDNVYIGNRAHRFVYRVVEADDVVASNDPRKSFERRPDYPEIIQGRVYHGEAGRGARERVVEMAGQIVPEKLTLPSRSVSGAPVVTGDGVAIVGNQRAMAQSLAYDRGGQGLKESLVRDAPLLGIDPAEVERMQRPVLVRELTDVNPADHQTLATLNQLSDVTGAKQKSPLVAAAGRARQLARHPEIVEDLSSQIGADQTMNDFLASPKGPELLNKLVKAEVITPAELDQFRDAASGKLTKFGRERISEIIPLLELGGNPAVVDQAPASILAKLEQAWPAAVKATGTGEDWTLQGPLKEALELHTQKIDNGMGSIADLVGQEDMFGRKAGADSPGVAMARFLETHKKAEVTAAFRQYAQAAEESARAGQSHDIFGAQPETPEAAFKRIFTDWRDATDELQGGLRRAGAVGEQPRARGLKIETIQVKEFPDQGWTRAYGKDGKMIGELTWTYSPKTNEIYPRSVFVKKEFRRQGVATAIYDAVREKYPDAELGFTLRTEKGQAFRSAYEARRGLRRTGNLEDAADEPTGGRGGGGETLTDYAKRIRAGRAGAANEAAGFELGGMTGSGLGGIAGGAVGGQIGDTPEERRRNAGLGFALGAGAGAGLGAEAGKAAFGVESRALARSAATEAERPAVMDLTARDGRVSLKLRGTPNAEQMNDIITALRKNPEKFRYILYADNGRRLGGGNKVHELFADLPFTGSSEGLTAPRIGTGAVGDQPDMFGGGPAQGELLGAEAGRAAAPKGSGSFAAKQEEARANADFLRKQLERMKANRKTTYLGEQGAVRKTGSNVLEKQDRAIQAVAAQIAELDRIAGFNEKISPAELATRAAAERTGAVGNQPREKILTPEAEDQIRELESAIQYNEEYPSPWSEASIKATKARIEEVRADPASQANRIDSPIELPSRTADRYAEELRRAGQGRASQNLLRFMRGSKVRTPLFHASFSAKEGFMSPPENDIGIHLGTVDQANDRVFQRAEVLGDLNRPGQNNLPVYAQIKNPIRLKDMGTWGADADWLDLVEASGGKITREEVQKALARTKTPRGDDVTPIRDLLRRKGYDAIVYRNSGEGRVPTDLRTAYEATKAERDAMAAQQKAWTERGEGRPVDRQEWEKTERYYWTLKTQIAEARAAGSADSYAVLDPRQMKSAIGNSGAYSPASSRLSGAVGDQPDRGAYRGESDLLNISKVVEGADAQERVAQAAEKYRGQKEGDRQTFAEADVQRAQVVKELLAGDLKAAKPHIARKLTGVQLLARRDVIRQNDAMIEDLSKKLAGGNLTVAEHEEATRLMSKAVEHNDALISDLITGASQKGRDLNLLKRMANNSLDHDVWQIQAKRMLGPDRRLTDEMAAEIRKLVNEARSACGG